MAFINPDGMHISYECEDLIKELEADISEFGGDTVVTVWCKDIEGVTIYTNYDFIIEDEPLKDDEIEDDERIVSMTMSSLLMLLKQQNKTLIKREDMHNKSIKESKISFISEDLYQYNKKRLLSRKTYPLDFNNREIAQAFYERLKKEVPTARYYEEKNEGGQYITYDQRAEKKLLKMLEKRIDQYRRKIHELTGLKICINENIKPNKKMEKRKEMNNMNDMELREALEEFYESCTRQGYLDIEENAEYFCEENYEYDLDKSEVIKILEEISRREE